MVLPISLVNYNVKILNCRGERTLLMIITKKKKSEIRPSEIVFIKEETDSFE